MACRVRCLEFWFDVSLEKRGETKFITLRSGHGTPCPYHLVLLSVYSVTPIHNKKTGHDEFHHGPSFLHFVSY